MMASEVSGGKCGWHTESGKKHVVVAIEMAVREATKAWKRVCEPLRESAGERQRKLRPRFVVEIESGAPDGSTDDAERVCSYAAVNAAGDVLRVDSPPLEEQVADIGGIGQCLWVKTWLTVTAHSFSVQTWATS